MKRLFGSLDFCQVLLRLGFRVDKQHGSSHSKFSVPLKHKVPAGVRPFMIIQLNKKQFDKHTCSRYITELVQMGFDRNKITNAFED